MVNVILSSYKVKQAHKSLVILQCFTQQQNHWWPIRFVPRPSGRSQPELFGNAVVSLGVLLLLNSSASIAALSSSEGENCDICCSRLAAATQQEESLLEWLKLFFRHCSFRSLLYCCWDVCRRSLFNFRTIHLFVFEFRPENKLIESSSFEKFFF